MMGRHGWLTAYLKRRFLSGTGRAGGRGPVHVMFLCTDHFEPGTGGADRQASDRRMDTWVSRYPGMAAGHRDFDGRTPRHGWFYPPHYYDPGYLSRLSRLCFDGLGEVELHLHHRRDTPESLQKLLEKTLADYNRLGMLLTIGEKPESRYAFIHGMWSLDNARGPEYCGVDSELLVLSSTGCFGDFTFPSGGPAQPRQVNGIYYAKDDPDRPKSYDRGKPVRTGGAPWGDLLIFQGPLHIDFSPLFRLNKPAVDLAGVNRHEPGTPRRIDAWVRTAVHVTGRPDWIFVKVSTHSAQEENHGAIVGEEADRMYTYLERHYNDGDRYRLHYVTAREAYNIVRAAEAGMAGNPYDYRDFLVKPYANTVIRASVPYRLIRYTQNACVLDLPEGEAAASFRFKNAPVTRLEADALRSFDCRYIEGDRRFRLCLAGRGRASVTLQAPPGGAAPRFECPEAERLDQTGEACTMSLSLDHPEKKLAVSLTG
jgi:hypothetical protein